MKHKCDKLSSSSEGPGAGFILADQNVITTHSLISGAIDDPETLLGYAPIVWKSINKGNVESDVIDFGGTWSACDVFAKSSPCLPKDQDDADAR